MNQTDIAKIAKQHALYRTEAEAKRRNLADAVIRREPSAIVGATIVNEATMMIIRTEAKAVAIEELAEALGIALEVEG